MNESVYYIEVCRDPAEEPWNQIGSAYRTVEDARRRLPLIKDTYHDFDIRIIMVVEEL